eukprot:CAMPEP_0172608908 /NCGR_PEP_ID=MMETSP1068-20121228/28953_1 /TAXON_ID=35684 /ORGANISM="Pseudopedinella elastica, Strain CCMP716" /LENGTH=660 /DNA_ID=CAMNT_0013412297 /DNA_START=49 /DNA_END=2032 /DNA_ORIENTATION=+
MGRSYKAETGKKHFTDPENTPAVMMAETLERRFFSGVFDDVLLDVIVTPGMEGKNAVITKWTDPIREHDKKVLEIEELIEVYHEKNKVYKQELRTVNNWETGWMLLNSRPDDLVEYSKLKIGMKDFSERLAKVKEPEDYATMEDEYRKFKELQGRAERLLEAEKLMNRCKEDLDEALKVMLQASKDLDKARKEEDEISSRISDDHVEADKKSIGIQELYPKITPGMILTKIHDTELEDREFEDIIKFVKKAKRPHVVVFRRYDFQQDMLSGEWQSLQQLRILGRYVVDPRVRRHLFVESGRRGEFDQLQASLERGEDVNATDLTECSAFHCAAANGHIKCMELLLEHGANMEQRDCNMETPLLQACRRGNIKVVAWLVEHNASLDAKDKLMRTPLFHAILSGNVTLVEYLVQIRTGLTMTDKTWKWTPLHYAAYMNSAVMVEMLLGRRASPYIKSKAGWTPLRCAEESQSHACVAVLREYIFNEPAQCVLPAKTKSRWSTNIWLGRHAGAYVRWATDRGIGAVLSLYQPGRRDPKHLWLSDTEEEGGVKWLPIDLETEDEDETNSSWERLAVHLPKILAFMDMSINEGRDLLVHCENGVSTSAAVVALHIMIKRRARYHHAVEHIKSHRREVALSPSFVLGMKAIQEDWTAEKSTASTSA